MALQINELKLDYLINYTSMTGKEVTDMLQYQTMLNWLYNDHDIHLGYRKGCDSVGIICVGFPENLLL